MKKLEGRNDEEERKKRRNDAFLSVLSTPSPHLNQTCFLSCLSFSSSFPLDSLIVDKCSLFFLLTSHSILTMENSRRKVGKKRERRKTRETKERREEGKLEERRKKKSEVNLEPTSLSLSFQVTSRDRVGKMDRVHLKKKMKISSRAC